MLVQSDELEMRHLCAAWHETQTQSSVLGIEFRQSTSDICLWRVYSLIRSRAARIQSAVAVTVGEWKNVRSVKRFCAFTHFLPSSTHSRTLSRDISWLPAPSHRTHPFLINRLMELIFSPFFRSSRSVIIRPLWLCVGHSGHYTPTTTTAVADDCSIACYWSVSYNSSRRLRVATRIARGLVCDYPRDSEQHPAGRSIVCEWIKTRSLLIFQGFFHDDQQESTLTTKTTTKTTILLGFGYITDWVHIDQSGLILFVGCCDSLKH